MSEGGDWTGPEGQPASAPIHTVPNGDLREHVIGADCPCMPRLVRARVQQGADGVETCPDETVPGVYVHNSYDLREVGEVMQNALDLLGKALADHHHQWTPAERDAYEHACHLVLMHWPRTR